jgi:hypothetical protein
VWRDAAGDVAITYMNGLAAPAWTQVTGISNAIPIVGIGDVDGDGVAEVLCLDPGTGTFGAWRISPSAQASWVSIATASPAWKVAGVGDFDGDGTADVLWRETATGNLGIWLMSHLVPTWAFVGGSSLEWNVAGIGDFDGDGKSDILWINPSNGQLGIFFMNGAVPRWASAGGSSLAWNIVGVGDFDGDAKSDILWREQTTGNLGIYFMNGPVQTWAGVGPLPTTQSVANIGDYDGDGKADLLVRETASGDVDACLMNGASRSCGAIGTFSPSWSVSADGSLPSAAAPVILISDPTTMTSGNSYQLTTDLLGPTNSNVQLDSLSDVTFDCAGHQMLLLSANDCHNLTIKNCRIGVSLQFSGVYLSGSGIVFDSNTVTADTVGIGIMVSGSGHTISNGTFIGGGVTDDSMVLDGTAQTVQNVVIKNNVFKNAFDCGVEGLGRWDNITISDNSFFNITGEFPGVGAAICGWYADWSEHYGFALTNSTFVGNVTDTLTPLLFVFFTEPGGWVRTNDDAVATAELPSNTFSGDLHP